MGPYDAVWIDAPCTGSGVIRRHPEVRWVKGERELDSLLEVQGGLVQEAAPLVRPGGFLMYSVCSVLSDELLAARALVTKGGVGFEVAREWLLADEADGFSGVLLRRR
jgi:16S rRNA (cytosine967-C5)-methyltransferase